MWSGLVRHQDKSLILSLNYKILDIFSRKDINLQSQLGQICAILEIFSDIFIWIIFMLQMFWHSEANLNPIISQKSGHWYLDFIVNSKSQSRVWLIPNSAKEYLSRRSSLISTLCWKKTSFITRRISRLQRMFWYKSLINDQKIFKI